MSGTNITFIDYVTPVPASWLNFVNSFVNSGQSSNYIAPLTGSIARTFTSKLSDDVSVGDFGSPVTTATLAAAVTGVQLAGGGRLHLPNGSYTGVAIPPSINTVLLDYDGPNTPVSLFGETLGSQFVSQKSLVFQDNSSHAGHGHAMFSVQNNPIGTNNIGVLNADFALTVSLLKQNFASTTQGGELDGGYFVIRNGGSNSDTTGFLVDVANYGTGFNATFESNTTAFVGGVLTYQIDAQLGVIDTRTNHQYGLVLGAVVGELPGTALLLQSQFASTGAAWQNFLQCIYNNVVALQIDGTGQITQTPATGGNAYSIRNIGGTLSVANNNAATQTLSLDQTGNLNVNGYVGIGNFQLYGIAAATATAGAATLPAQPVGFFTVQQGATVYKVPYYNA